MNFDEVFTLIDHSKDGNITAGELSNFLFAGKGMSYGFAAEEAALDACKDFLEQWDKGSDKQLDCSEFVAVMERAVDRIDTNGDGDISKGEILGLFAKNLNTIIDAANARFNDDEKNISHRELLMVMVLIDNIFNEDWSRDKCASSKK